MSWLQGIPIVGEGISRAPVGVDLGSATACAAQVAMVNGRPALIAGATTSVRENPAEALDRLLCAIERQGGSVAETIIAAPTDEVLSLALELPPRDSGAPLEKIAHAELARAHDYPENALSSALRETGRGKNGQTLALGLGLTIENGEKIIATMESCGARVEQLLPPQGAYEQISSHLGQPCSFFLDMGAKGVRSMVCERGTLVLERALPLESSADVDALSEEIEVTQGFLTHMRPGMDVDKIWLVGGAATRPGLAAALTKELESDVEVLTPAHVVQVGSHFRSIADDPGMMLALGLSMSGMANANEHGEGAA